jgi:hypothetical protein
LGKYAHFFFPARRLRRLPILHFLICFTSFSYPSPSSSHCRVYLRLPTGPSMTSMARLCISLPPLGTSVPLAQRATSVLGCSTTASSSTKHGELSCATVFVVSLKLSLPHRHDVTVGQPTDVVNMTLSFTGPPFSYFARDALTPPCRDRYIRLLHRPKQRVGHDDHSQPYGQSRRRDPAAISSQVRWNRYDPVLRAGICV